MSFWIQVENKNLGRRSSIARVIKQVIYVVVIEFEMGYRRDT